MPPSEPRDPRDPIEVARLVADSLTQAGVAHAIGGALAYAYWGVPRATRDVDVNLFVTAANMGPALDALHQAGLEFDTATVMASAADRGDAKVYCGDVRVDLFVNSIPFHDEAAKRVVSVPLGPRPALILSAEDLAVFKLLFFRSKDTVDLERMLALRRDSFDIRYVRHWVVDTVGEDDERVRYWDRLCDELCDGT